MYWALIEARAGQRPRAAMPISLVDRRPTRPPTPRSPAIWNLMLSETFRIRSVHARYTRRLFAAGQQVAALKHRGPGRVYSNWQRSKTSEGTMAPENDKQSNKSAIAGGAGGHRVVMTGHTGGRLFQPGNPGGPGRPRGSRNRLEADIMNAAVRAGFIKLDENGNRVGSDRDGCQAYLNWVAGQSHFKRASVARRGRLHPSRLA